MRNSEWMTANEAAEIMGPISVDTVYALANKRKIIRRKVGGRVQINRASVDEYLARAVDPPIVSRQPTRRAVASEACFRVHFPRKA